MEVVVLGSVDGAQEIANELIAMGLCWHGKLEISETVPVHHPEERRLRFRLDGQVTGVTVLATNVMGMLPEILDHLDAAKS